MKSKAGGIIQFHEWILHIKWTHVILVPKSPNYLAVKLAKCFATDGWKFEFNDKDEFNMTRSSIKGFNTITWSQQERAKFRIIPNLFCKNIDTPGSVWWHANKYKCFPKECCPLVRLHWVMGMHLQITLHQCTIFYIYIYMSYEVIWQFFNVELNSHIVFIVTVIELF